MRTDRRPDRRRVETAPVSRRAFVIAGGSVAATGIAGTASGTTDGFGRPVEVAASEPYLPAVTDVVETYEGPTVSVHSTNELDRKPDLRISGRPIAGDSTARAAAIQGWAALSHPDGAWRDCQCRSDLRDHWSSDAPVETWSESDWRSVGEPDDRTDAVVQSDAATSVFVRGVRSYQYARGRGGVGYYGVDSTDIEELPVASDDHTPVARIAYLHFDEDALSGDRLSSFLDHYTRRTGDTGGGVTSFVDPAIEN